MPSSPNEPDARAARQAKVAAAAPKQSKVRPLLVGALVLILLVGIGLAVWSGTRSDDSASTGQAAGQAYPKGATGPDGGIVVDAKTKAGAPTLDIYEDFQCPACKSAEDALGPTIDKMAASGDAKVVYHMKTFLDANLKNDSSTRAALAGACAADAGRFQQFHDTVFANQPAQEGQGYTDAQLEQFAQKSGITGDALTTWKSCYSSKKYADYVKNVEDATARAGVLSTPSFQVNGKKFDLQEQKVTSADDFRAKVLAAGK